MPFSTDRFVARLRRRLFVGEFLHVAAVWFAGLLVAAGVAVLAVKLFAPRYVPYLPWLALAAVPVLALAAWRAKRRMPSDREAVALLDARLGAGGLLMTLAERPDPNWRDRLPAAERWAAVLPRVRPVRFARVVAAPALFAVGAGFVPPREEPTPPPRVTVGTDAARELTEAFELLEKVDAIDEESKDSVRQELDRLAEETKDAPLTHEKWETVDALRERLRSGLDATDLSVSQGLSAAAALAAGLTDAEPLSAARSEQLTQNLLDALETLRKNGAFDAAAKQAGAGLPPELQQLLKSGAFQLSSDPAARQQALAQLQRMLESESAKLAEARGECQACLGGDAAAAGGDRPGRGGVSRGGGPAELTFGAESDDQAVKFKEAVLPPGFFDKPAETTVGVTAAAPEVEPAAAATRNAARGDTPAAGKATWDRPLRPRHREVVRGYFGDE